MAAIEQRHWAALGLTVAAGGLVGSTAASTNLPGSSGTDILLLATALLLVAVAVAAWRTMRLLALVGFFIALYPAGHAWWQALQVAAPDVGARSFLLLVPVIGLPMTLLSLRRSNPVHLSVAFVCGAATGLWWLVVDLAGNLPHTVADLLLGSGFLLASFCLSSRWRDDAQAAVLAMDPIEAHGET